MSTQIPPQPPSNYAAAAAAIFAEGFNCSTAVFAAFAPQFGLDQTQALRLACAFGGGLARQGDTCGAVSGALLILGLRYGQTIPGDTQTKDHVYALGGAFIERFTASCGASKCRELLGYDISTPQGRRQAHEHNRSKIVCPQLVMTAAQILEAMLAAEG